MRSDSRPAHETADSPASGRPDLASGPLVRNPGFGVGYTPITRAGEAALDTGIDFGVLRLRAGEEHRVPAGRETALLLLAGEVAFSAAGETWRAARGSLFGEDPVALHVDHATTATLRAERDAELLLARTDAGGRFSPVLFDRGNMVGVEHRAQGLLDDTAYRLVKTVFDLRNRPEATLVLGEVVTFPGRWSSYPPHHHPHPELYHYRFDAPQGYGIGEAGEEVFRLRDGDTLKILDRAVHSQVAAPGYTMWYAWVLRHLPGAPYRGPDFVAEHTWTMQPGARAAARIAGAQQ